MSSNRPCATAVTGQDLLLASAGSGKTFRLSSRLIALLAMDVPPQEILASTFTRKAAGEITDRMFVRLAEGARDPDRARELAESMPIGIDLEGLTPDGCAKLLLSTVRDLHRLQVLTLDAFFYRVARTFALNLGFPPAWKLAQEPDRERLRARAIEAALRDLDPLARERLIRDAGYGAADRDVHRVLLEGVTQLHGVFRALDPEVAEPWGLAPTATGIDPRPLEVMVAQFQDAALPRAKGGEVDNRWRQARKEAIDALLSGNWERFLTVGLARAVIAKGGSYSGRAIPSEIQEALAPLIRLAREALLAQRNRRIAAIGRFLPEYDRSAARIQREEALYHFDDMTHALSKLGGMFRARELSYRLDLRIQHLLLDEFQDTSNEQWSALASFTEEIFSGEPGRALFIVADPKQSIYGWRGGEPRILDDLQERLGLTVERVSRSWRSSSAVLNAVNAIFYGIEDNPVLVEDRDAVRSWARGFDEHHPERDLLGHVCLEVGPAEEGKSRRNFRPALLDHAARQVVKLHRSAPGATIGILTRTNRSAAYLFAHLQREGVDASEEGGVPVADSAVVLAVLALLRMVDHPADTISRYLVSMTPVSQIVGLGPEDWADERAVAREIRLIRRRLLSEGYGRVLSDWAEILDVDASTRDGRRLRQLTELAFRWDDRATTRPADFVRAAEAARVEDPASSAIRVMTIHGAKGLEFDAVVLPDLDGLSFAGDRSDSFVAFRSGGTGPIQRVLPRVTRELLPLFPELSEAVLQDRESRLRDSLSTLYVALTRARHAIYVYVGPDPKGTSTARTGARLLREALAPKAAAREGSALYLEGDPVWWGSEESVAPLSAAGIKRQSRAVPRVEPLVLPRSPRLRMIPHRTPSELDADGGLDQLLRRGGRQERARGVVVHHWLSTIEWIERGVQPDGQLLAEAADLVPAAVDLPGLLRSFHGWLQNAEIRNLLSQAAFPPGTRVARELSFIVRDDNRVVEGRADRLLYVPDSAGPRMTVVDWKSDSIEPENSDAMQRIVERYRLQMQAYTRALAKSEEVPPDRVEAVLAFLSAGVVRRI